MVSGIRFAWSIFSAAAVAGAVAAALALGAAGLGWFVGSPVLAGALAMLVSATLIIGFGGLSLGALIVVGLSWASVDWILSRQNLAGATAHVTMAAAYFMLGLTQGMTRHQVVHAGAGPMLGSTLGIAIAAAVFPRSIADGIDEAVLSAAMISAARAAREFVAVTRLQDGSDRTGRPEEPDASQLAEGSVSGSALSLNEEVADLLAALDGPRSEDAICALTARRETLPFVAEAYQRKPTDPKRRRSLVRCLWQYRDAAILPTLRVALRDPDDLVWKEALDGFVTLGGGVARQVLEEERAALAEAPRTRVKREWIDEAIGQIDGQA